MCFAGPISRRRLKSSSQRTKPHTWIFSYPAEDNTGDESFRVITIVVNTMASNPTAM